MTAHVVLLRPKPDLSDHQREALLEAMRVAFTGIAEVKRVRVGKRIRLGRPYDELMTGHYEFVCVIEFDDEAALSRYLDHPAHAELGRLFYVTADAALVYDFTMVEPGRIGDLLT